MNENKGNICLSSSRKNHPVLPLDFIEASLKYRKTARTPLSEISRNKQISVITNKASLKASASNDVFVHTTTIPWIR